MARGPRSLPTQSDSPPTEPQLPESTPPSSPSSQPPTQTPTPDLLQFRDEVLRALSPLSPTDIARLAGPQIHDLGFPDPLGYFQTDVESFGLRIREHLLDRSGSLTGRYTFVLYELARHSQLQAPSYALTALLRLAASELLVQHSSNIWAPLPPNPSTS